MDVFNQYLYFSMDYLFEIIFKHSNRQFKYLQNLGKGVFGNVFLVASSKGEKFALKVINLEKMDNGSTEKVMQEVEILSQLKHKNILGYKGHFYVKNKCLCIFSSYCEGGSLAENLQELTFPKIKDHMMQIAEGLAFVHEKGIIHQDIKLENIFLSGDTAQIGDFGLAMNIEDAQPMCLTSFRGTPFYMAPQMLQNKKNSQASDVWALGLVFLELTLKKRIHHILKGAQVLCRRPDFPEVLLQKVEKIEVRMLIRLMLKQNPIFRPTVSQVLTYLKNPSILTSQPDVNVHLKASRCHSLIKVIKYSDSGSWSRNINCEQCGGQATLIREVPNDEDKENLLERSRISRQRLYRAGFGAKWYCSVCDAKGFWLTYQL